MHPILEQISQIGIVPVIKIDDAEKALPLAKALMKGGIPCAEVTFRTSQAEESIRRITASLPDILVGAGTVLTTEQVDKAIAAGAKFIVSPGLNPKVISHCIKRQIPIAPGCATPSDIEQALEFGLEVVKFFPAEQAGGLDYIKAVAAPYTNIKFMPTGGINICNVTKYLAFEKNIACGGSWMVNADLISDGEFSKITSLCRQTMQAVLGFELAHMGINSENEQEAKKTVQMFETLFGFEMSTGDSSIFAGKYVEAMKNPFLGKNGHIAIAVNNTKRGVAYLERLGIKFDQDTAKTDAKGNLNTIYMCDEIGGFAVHLLQKK